MNLTGYDILEKIGEGPAGVVWKALQVSLDRIVAIRVLNPDLISEPQQFERLLTQIRAAAKLTHPNLVQIYNVDCVNNTHFIVMEHLSGTPLSDLLKKKRILPPKEAFRIAFGISQALADAWEHQHIIHGDLRPGNIIINSDQSIKITDLGMTLDIGTKQLAAQIDAGTMNRIPHYMAPEHLDPSVTRSFPCDMYSLGALLYHMMSGIRPFQEHDDADVVTMHRDGTLPDPRKVRPSIPVPAIQLMRKLLAKSPSRRHSDWDQLTNELKKLAAGKFILSKASDTFKSTLQGGNGSSPVKSGPKKPRYQVKRSVPSVPLRFALYILLAAWFLVFTVIKIRNTAQPNSNHEAIERNDSSSVDSSW
jgi:serine/threonine protein kinase